MKQHVKASTAVYVILYLSELCTCANSVIVCCLCHLTTSNLNWDLQVWNLPQVSYEGKSPHCHFEHVIVSVITDHN